MSNLPATTRQTALIERQSADQNPAAVYLAGLTSKQSQRTMRGALETIAAIISNGQQNAETMQWGALRFQHTSAIRAKLAERYQHTTANKILSALRGVLKAAYRLGYMTPDEYANASYIDAVKGQSTPAGRDLALGEVLALIEACRQDATPSGARDVAMIGILYGCGLRRAELVGLDLADYDPDSGKITIQHGKGGKDRTVYAQNGTKAALDAWIGVRGQSAGPLFWAYGRGNIHYMHGLTSQSVYNILKHRAKQAKVKDFSPHDFRRTFVGNLLDRGADISTVSKLAGHASVTTTQRYDRRNEEVKREASTLIHFPFTSASRAVQEPLPMTPKPKRAKKPTRTASSKSKSAGLPEPGGPDSHHDLLELFVFEKGTHGVLAWQPRSAALKRDKPILAALRAAGYIEEIVRSTRQVAYRITDAGRKVLGH